MASLEALKKRFGQHFLNDRSILARIVALAHIHASETVLEIGAGAGALTSELAKTGAHVVAIEIDHDLISSLCAFMPPNVEIIEGDALVMKWPVDRFHVVGNLPYNVATPLLKRFIEQREHISDVTVMVQKEVAERLSAEPSTREYGPLSVLVQYYAVVKYGFTVPPGAFKPKPKVESAVIRLEWIPGVPSAPEFTDFVHRAFASRRKKLINNLLAIFGSLGRDEILRRLANVGIHENARPEELSVAEFLRVCNHLQ